MTAGRWSVRVAVRSCEAWCSWRFPFASECAARDYAREVRAVLPRVVTCPSEVDLLRPDGAAVEGKP